MKKYLALLAVVVILVASVFLHIGEKADFRNENPDSFFETKIELGDGLPVFSLSGAFNKINEAYYHKDKPGFITSYFASDLRPIYQVFEWDKSDNPINDSTEYGIEEASNYDAAKWGNEAKCFIGTINDTSYGYYTHFGTISEKSYYIETYLFEKEDSLIAVEICLPCEEITLGDTNISAWIPTGSKKYNSTDEEKEKGFIAGYKYSTDFSLPIMLFFKPESTSISQTMMGKEIKGIKIYADIIETEGFPSFDIKTILDSIH